MQPTFNIEYPVKSMYVAKAAHWITSKNLSNNDMDSIKLHKVK